MTLVHLPSCLIGIVEDYIYGPNAHWRLLFKDVLVEIAEIYQASRFYTKKEYLNIRMYDNSYPYCLLDMYPRHLASLIWKIRFSDRPFNQKALDRIDGRFKTYGNFAVP